MPFRRNRYRVPSLQPKGIFKDCLRIRNIGMREKALNRSRIYTPGEFGDCSQCLQFRCETKPESLYRQSIVQGLLAEAVPRKEHLRVMRIPNGECEHAIKKLRHAFALFFIQVHQNFSITFRPEAMA